MILSETNSTDHKSITARHFLRDNTRVEADFSIWRDYGPRVHLWIFFQFCWSNTFLSLMLTFSAILTLTYYDKICLRSVKKDSVYNCFCNAKGPDKQHQFVNYQKGGIEYYRLSRYSQAINAPVSPRKFLWSCMMKVQP